MLKTQRTELLHILDEAFPDPQVPLQHRNAFELLLSVILSAQCTDERVNQITPFLFPKNEPCTPEHILKLGVEQVRKLIYSTGYFNSKTQAIMGCAKAIQARGGDVPSSFEELTALPGVGPKTAQVIQAQWFQIPAFPVDTHIHRVANRLGLADSGKNRAKTERQVKAQIPKDRWSKLHLQLIFHGRKTCTAYKPKCGLCPLYKLCTWDKKDSFTRLPPP